MKRRRGDWVQTYSGGRFYPLDPLPSEIVPADICHALAHTCRFNGHVRKFYSVAEHSVLLSYAVPRRHARWALMHDAAEAYLSDVPRPTKPALPGYGELEAEILRAVARRVGLEGDAPPKAVMEADARILMDEKRQLMARSRYRWKLKAEPLGITVHAWEPWLAKVAFARRFGELFPGVR